MQNSSIPPNSSDHVLTLCHMLSNRIGKAFAEELDSQAITVAEWRVLLTLAQHSPASGKQIAGRWAMDKMAINRAISSLQRRNLIKKKINSVDKRVIDLMLSASGHKLYDQLLPVANERYHKLLSGLNSIEEKQLRTTLLKLIVHVDEIEE